MNKSALFHQFVAFTATIHQVTHDLTQNITAANITPLQYKILEYIKVSQPVTPTEISECQHMSLPNTSRELRKLQERQLIQNLATQPTAESSMSVCPKKVKNDGGGICLYRRTLSTAYPTRNTG